MPTYEYKCDGFGHTFDLFQSIKARPIKKCPSCGKNRVKRLISVGGGLIIKGTGFYITDYRDKSYADKAKSESGTTTESKPAEGGETKTESKAAAEKSETKPAATAETKPAAKPRGRKKD